MRLADQTHIQWTDATWNPVLGCSKVSEGCRNCYAMADAWRKLGHPHPRVREAYAGLTEIRNHRPQWTGIFRELPGRLEEPLHWKKPRRVFVNSMSDLFGEGISDEFLDQVFGVMALTSHHQFQVLTKRPERMAEYFTARSGSPPPAGSAADITPALVQRAAVELVAHGDAAGAVRGSQALRAAGWRWPLRNVWLGVSCEDQPAADARIPLLLETPAVVRFLSCEPLLRPIDLEPFFCKFCGGLGLASPHGASRPCPACRGSHYGREDDPRLHWVIVGGESGPAARSMEWHWIERIIDQCRQARVPVFIKQLGSRPGYRHPKGGDPAEWPEEFRVREFPEVAA